MDEEKNFDCLDQNSSLLKNKIQREKGQKDEKTPQASILQHPQGPHRYHQSDVLEAMALGGAASKQFVGDQKTLKSSKIQCDTLLSREYCPPRRSEAQELRRLARLHQIEVMEAKALGVPMSKLTTWKSQFIEKLDLDENDSVDEQKEHHRGWYRKLMPQSEAVARSA